MNVNMAKKTWRLINNVIRPGYTPKKQTIANIIDDGIEFTKPLDIAEKIKCEFSLVGRKIADSCPGW